MRYFYDAPFIMGYEFIKSAVMQHHKFKIECEMSDERFKKIDKGVLSLGIQSGPEHRRVYTTLHYSKN